MKLSKFIFHVVLGFILGDLLSTFVHWFEDSYIHYCTTNTFLNLVARENEMHHYMPFVCVSSTYWENIENSVIVILVFVIFLLVFFFKHLSKYMFFWISFGMSLLLGILNHRFCHERDCRKPLIIQYIHKSNIIVGSEMHRKHHINPNSNYSLTFCHTNYILNFFNVFPILEHIIFIVSGIKPSRKKGYDDYEKTNFHDIVSNSSCPDKLCITDIDILYNNLDNFYKCNLLAD